MLGERYSGIVLNQNANLAGAFSFAGSLFPAPSLFPGAALFATGAPSSFYQTFYLPPDYVRGDATEFIPALTGFHLFGGIATGQQATASLAWEFDVLDPRTQAWVTQATGLTVGTAHDGVTWFTALFDEPLTIFSTWLNTAFRIKVINPIGFTEFFFSLPNPIPGQAFNLDGTPLLGETTSILFRVLGAVADSGTDFLGDTYRSSVVQLAATNVSSISTSDNTAWLSQPNPSRFATEALYFDQRDRVGNAVVIDQLTLDPLTPGVFFTIYYSNDPTGPGTDVPSWENLLWTPVYQQYQANRRQTYTLPQPITAKYVMIEFTQLQPRSYNPGLFELPTTFKKHPKWVLDYFLARLQTQALDLMSSGTIVTFDALDLAFDYYRDDIITNADPPPFSQSPTSQQIQFFQQESNGVPLDSQTLARIRVAFQPFTSQPALLGRFGSILGAYAAVSASSSYPTETIQRAFGDTSQVSNLQREALLVEHGFPVMFFFVPSRHSYRVSQALFKNNLAYFAGVKQVAFHREIFTGAADRLQYNEELGDGANLHFNDAATPPPLPAPDELLLIPNLLL